MNNAFDQHIRLHTVLEIGYSHPGDDCTIDNSGYEACAAEIKAVAEAAIAKLGLPYSTTVALKEICGFPQHPDGSIDVSKLIRVRSALIVFDGSPGHEMIAGASGFCDGAGRPSLWAKVAADYVSRPAGWPKRGKAVKIIDDTWLVHPVARMLGLDIKGNTDIRRHLADTVEAAVGEAVIGLLTVKVPRVPSPICYTHKASNRTYDFAGMSGDQLVALRAAMDDEVFEGLQSRRRVRKINYEPPYRDDYVHADWFVAGKFLRDYLDLGIGHGGTPHHSMDAYLDQLDAWREPRDAA